MPNQLNETQVLAYISQVSAYNNAFAIKVKGCTSEDGLFNLFTSFVKPVFEIARQVKLGKDELSGGLDYLFRSSRDNFWNAAARMNLTEQMQNRINDQTFGR